MRYKSSLALPTFAGNHFADPIPAELDYDCYVQVTDDGSRLEIESVYIPDLDLTLKPTELCRQDKQRILLNLKHH